MAPKKRRKVSTTPSRRPLATAQTSSCGKEQILPTLKGIFNIAQHVTTADQALTQIKNLYNNETFADFEKPFMDCVKRLLQAEFSIYFKNTCGFICKFLQHVTNLEDDRLVRSCADVTNHYMQIGDDKVRLNALCLFCELTSQLESLDEDIIGAFRVLLPKRIRDKKPAIRAQAVLASRKFQDDKIIRDAFLFHYSRDPELTVRKALLQTMDVDVFGLDFLVESTQDLHEIIRKKTFQRLAKIQPKEFTKEQLHVILHNGLVERDRLASFAFKTSTLDPWLSKMYDDLDLVKLLKNFDVINHPEDVERLLNYIHQRDLDKVENHGAATKLHHVVEAFREKWLGHKCIPALRDFNERVVVVWLSLIKFCKDNQSSIKSVKIRTVQASGSDPNQSIENILNSQEQNDEVIELYERLTPDLVNLIDFLNLYIRHIDPLLTEGKLPLQHTEFAYQRLMDYIATHEINDEIERKTVQEVLGSILKENLLTDRFENFIPPIVKCLSTLIYSRNSNLMINYISEMIQNIRSHLEDIAMNTQPVTFKTPQAKRTVDMPRSAIKKVANPGHASKRVSLPPMRDEQDLDYKLATIGVELEELKDQLEECLQKRDYDAAKNIDNKIAELKNDYKLYHQRRYSIASDVSQLILDIDDEPEDNKLSSTKVADLNSTITEESMNEIRIFKNHPNEIIKCFQMYYACLEHAKISEVPQIMLNHLEHLSCESLDDWFYGKTRIWSLMIACNGLSALVDKNFAKLERTMTVLESGFIDKLSEIEIRTISLKSFVDVVVQHEDVDFQNSISKVEDQLKTNMRNYGLYDPKTISKSELAFITTMIHGVAKLYFHRKLESADLLSHMICWWYHPRTHSTLTQFIGVFLPAFVKESTKKIRSADDTWLEELLADTYITSTRFLYNYISNEGRCIMSTIDVQNLLAFLANLVPTSFHRRVHDAIDVAVDDCATSEADLAGLWKNSKKNLAAIEESPLATSVANKRTSDCNETQDPITVPLNNL